MVGLWGITIWKVSHELWNSIYQSPLRTGMQPYRCVMVAQLIVCSLVPGYVSPITCCLAPRARASQMTILAPKLTSRACALWVCSPPAAIAVTQAISQTLICKALRIDSPSHAQMNKQCHKTWSFCLKYYILSKSNKIQRQVGGIFHLWQFSLDQIAHGRWPGIKKWRHVNKWKPWSFQLHCAVKPYFTVTKWKMHLLNTW